MLKLLRKSSIFCVFDSKSLPVIHVLCMPFAQLALEQNWVKIKRLSLHEPRNVVLDGKRNAPFLQRISLKMIDWRKVVIMT